MKRASLVITALVLAAPVSAEEFALEDAVAVCSGCHGEDGIPADAEFPIIWGQEFFYIYTQLKDYAAGRRESEIMTPIASEYSRDQMKDIAQHFADRAWPGIEARAEDGDEKLAERGITGGQCSACHGKWEGDSRIPRLAGQQPGYLRKTMLDFKNEVRMNAPDKISTMKQLSDETIEALSRYLASL
ncbi:c-type cytochrome [Oricola cellulosilytica]|nr:c-type cytochrome [Oricola cellulosilytica]